MSPVDALRYAREILAQTAIDYSKVLHSAGRREGALGDALGRIEQAAHRFVRADLADKQFGGDTALPPKGSHCCMCDRKMNSAVWAHRFGQTYCLRCHSRIELILDRVLGGDDGDPGRADGLVDPKTPLKLVKS